MSAPDLTISDYLAFFSDHAAGRILRWQFAESHQDRLMVLEEILDACYRMLINTRGLNKDRSEDELTMNLANMLCCSGLPAHHDKHVNGHCDLIIEAENGFMWLGEAKIHRGYAWLEDGFLQLSTRYGTAMLGRDHGELIIYHRAGDANATLQEWKSRITKNHPNVEIEEDMKEANLFFRTRHFCPNSGCAFYVRHFILPLMHEPEK